MAKLDLGKPEKFGFLHSFLRTFWFLHWFKLWYKDITIVGKENLDKKTPTILAINHQNTAMDPLVLCGTILPQITWLARADLYEKKALLPIFHCFKILPIFRQRDGVKSLEKNDMVFRKVVEVICAKKLVGLFPEGTHWGFRRLRQTRKAIPRIVCMAAEQNNYDIDININPVGIYYEDYIDVRSNLFIKVGEPIPMRQYMAMLKENPQVAENEIRQATENGMRQCMLDIPQTDETYNTVDSLRYIYRNQTASQFAVSGNRQVREFLTDKKTIELIENQEKEQPGYIATLKEKVDSYTELLNKSKFSFEIVENNGGEAFQVIWNCMKVVALLPFFLCGCVTCSLTYFVMNFLGDKLAKDKLFKNSVMFVVGRLMTNIMHTIFIILWLMFVPLPWWTVFFFVAFLFFVWVVFIDYPKLVKKTILQLVFCAGFMTNDKDIVELCKRRDAVKNEYAKLLHLSCQ